MADSEKEQRKAGRGSHPNSRANLKRFQPGQSGNPEGKEPGTKDRATAYRRWLDVRVNVPNRDKKGNARYQDLPEVIECTLEERAALGQIVAAAQGNTNAWKEIQDSLHGKQVDKLELNLSALSDEELILFEQLRAKLIT